MAANGEYVVVEREKGVYLGREYGKEVERRARGEGQDGLLKMVRGKRASLQVRRSENRRV